MMSRAGKSNSQTSSEVGYGTKIESKGSWPAFPEDSPVGAVMTLSAGGDIRFKTRLVEGVSEDGISSPDRFLLDGQQRLTSLYQALLHPEAVSTQDSRGEKRLSWFYIDMRRAVFNAADREDAIIVVSKEKKTTRDFGRETVLDLSSPEFEYKELCQRQRPAPRPPHRPAAPIDGRHRPPSRAPARREPRHGAVRAGRSAWRRPTCCLSERGTVDAAFPARRPGRLDPPRRVRGGCA